MKKGESIFFVFFAVMLLTLSSVSFVSASIHPVEEGRGATPAEGTAPQAPVEGTPQTSEEIIKRESLLESGEVSIPRTFKERLILALQNYIKRKESGRFTRGSFIATAAVRGARRILNILI